MSPASAPWRLDRLPAETRDAAEQAAADAGMPLAEWLARLITDRAAREGITPPPPTQEPLLTIVPAAPPANPFALPEDEHELEPAPDETTVQRIAVSESAPEPVAEPADHPLDTPFPEDTVFLAIESLVPSGLGTRRADEPPPASLLAAIATAGLREPLLVRPAPKGHQIVTGLRRWRAAERIGLSELPAIVAVLDDAHALLASLAENLPHGDLPPLDEARAYLRLLTEFSVSAAEITRVIARERQHVVRAMRLLGLPARARELIESAPLSMDEALRLLDAPNPSQLAETLAAAHGKPA